MQKSDWAIIAFLAVILALMCLNAVVFTGCSCVRSDKDLTIDCDGCKVQYNHSRDYLEVKDKK